MERWKPLKTFFFFLVQKIKNKIQDKVENEGKVKQIK